MRGEKSFFSTDSGRLLKVHISPAYTVCAWLALISRIQRIRSYRPARFLSAEEIHNAVAMGHCGGQHGQINKTSTHKYEHIYKGHQFITKKMLKSYAYFQPFQM